jgi:hypothetical protein
MSNFSFIEYSYNPYDADPEDIFVSLNKLGFVQRNAHISGYYSMWTQNQSIILLRQSEDVRSFCITGLGLILKEELLEKYDAEFDEECSMHIMHDPDGLRILAMPEKRLSKMIAHGYQVVDKRLYESPGIEYFSGIVYNTSESTALEFYQDLGFRFTKSSEKYNTLMSESNRFTLLLNKEDNSKTIDIVYTDTNDVFKTTRCYTVAGLDLKEYTIEKDKLKFGVSLNHKIIGYNCAAFGNEESYSIENCVKQPLPNLDFIFRTRKQYLHINEEVVEFHNATT